MLFDTPFSHIRGATPYFYGSCSSQALDNDQRLHFDTLGASLSYQALQRSRGFSISRDAVYSSIWNENVSAKTSPRSPAGHIFEEWGLSNSARYVSHENEFRSEHTLLNHQVQGGLS